MLDYPYFKTHKMVAIDLGKQQGLDADPKAIKQINFTEYCLFCSNIILI